MSSLPCNLPGWGVAPWGTAPWGGSGSAIPGGPLPKAPPFNVYCAGPCGEISVLLTHPEVQVTPPGDFAVDVTTGDIVITSNDGSQADLYISDVPAFDWTLEFTINAKELPVTFSEMSLSMDSPTGRYFFVGVAIFNGASAGLYFTQTGIGYAATFDAAIQPLANSESFFTLDDYYVIRLAVSSTTGSTYLYITELSYYLKYGHQLRYVLPTINFNSTPGAQPQGTTILAGGTALAPTQVFLDELCLGNGLIIANLPPVAEAGVDQATELCWIVRLDGSASFDPEGGELTYFWRLIDAPVASMYCFTGNDGTTYAARSSLGGLGPTNLFFSSSFGGAIPVSAGDVLLVQGVPYNCVGTGVDGTYGPYVQIDGFDLANNLINVAFEILKQNGINNPTSVKPTFYPDAPGFYTFDLIVFDGSLYSDPRSVTVVNVLASPLPRGVIPDLSFTWNYLSDFWKLLEDPDRINTLWSGLAQVAATELYTLWQVEYSKSLRDIQRTFIRRWLHYDLLLREPFIELTSNRFIFRGVDTSNLTNAPFSADGYTVILSTTYLGLVSCTLVGDSSGNLTPAQIATQLQTAFQRVDSRFTVTVFAYAQGFANESVIRINAPFDFVVDGNTTFPYLGIGATNTTVSGTGGSFSSTKIYKVEISLLGIGVQTNDNLAVFVLPPDGSPGYWLSVRIAGIATDPNDFYPYQRIQLLDPIPQYATSTWQIPSKALSTQIDFWNGLVEFNDIALYEVYDSQEQTATYWTSYIVTSTETQTNTTLLDATNVAPFLELPKRFSVGLWGVYRQGYMPIESQIVDIPFLQRVIKNPNEQEVLRRNLDFFMDTYRGSTCIRFTPDVWIFQQLEHNVPYPPTPRLWAEYNYLDNRPAIEANFGIPVEFTLADLSQLLSTVDYLSAVQGLWYSYINGPTLFDLRVGSQILIGLPFAEVAGTITEIRTDFSPNTGQILVQDTADHTIVRQYFFPVVLPLEINPATNKIYVVGDTVQQFAPLVKGVEVEDWVSDSDWFQGYLSQGVFYEVQKFFTFLVKINSNIFNLSAALFVQNFILNIKPTYTHPLFVIEEDLNDKVNVSDLVVLIGHLDLRAGAIYAVKQTTVADSPDPGPGRLVSGIPQHWGHTPSGTTGTLSSHFVDAADTNTDVDYGSNTFPSFSTSDPVLIAGTDKPHLSPSQFITAFCSEVYAGGTPTADGVIFRTSFPAYQGTIYGLGSKYITDIPLAGIFYGNPATATGAQTLNCCEIFIEGTYDPSQGTNYEIKIFKNAVLNQTLSFTYNFTARNTFLFTDYLATFTPIAVVTNDVLTAQLVAVGGANRRVLWANFFVTLGTGVALGALSAGTYTRLAAL